jgi:hypothetical protein
MNVLIGLFLYFELTVLRILIYTSTVKFIFNIMLILLFMIKSRRMRWAGHVAPMGRRGMHIGYWWEIQEERDHWEDQDIGGWTILKWILER